MNVDILELARTHPRRVLAVPSLMFIASGVALLLLGGPWHVSAGGWDIYVGPVIMTIGMLVVAVLYARKAARWGLGTIDGSPEHGMVLVAKFTWYFILVMAIRQCMIWQYTNPWEKLPMVFLVLAHVTLVERVQPSEVGLKDWKRPVLLAALVLALLEIAGTNLGVVARAMATGAMVEVNLESQVYWLSFPYQFLAVGIAEELFFRGWMYTRVRVFLARRFKQQEGGDRRSIIITLLLTAAVFGLFHVPWYVGNWFNGDFSLDVAGCITRVASTGAMGIYLGYAYEKTGSIALPSLVHGLSNSIQPFLVTGPMILVYNPHVAFWNQWGHVIFGLAALPVFMLVTKVLAKRLHLHDRPLQWERARGDA